MTTAQTSEQPKRRGRPPGSKNKPKDGSAPKSADKTTEHDRVHLEDLTDEQEYALLCQHKRQYDRALTAKKAADAELKNVAKKAKAELGANVIDQIKLMHALESDEGKRALIERTRWQAKIARWQGMPVGHVDDLFAAEDRTPIEDKTYADGRRAGLAGEDNAPPHHLDGPLKSKWQAGYNDGQAVLAKGFKSTVGATFGVPPEAEETAVEKDSAYWMRMGRIAFESGQNGEPPDDVPAEHHEVWRMGWKNASTAAKHGHGAAPDYRAAGFKARTDGIGCSIPADLTKEQGENWYVGWKQRDAEMQSKHATAH